MTREIKTRPDQTRPRDRPKKMSTDTSSDEETKGYSRHFNIRDEDGFQLWQLKTLARAREKGFAKYLQQSTVYHTDADIATKQAEADAETDPARKTAKQRIVREMIKK